MAVTLNLSLLYKLYQHDSSRGGTLGGLIDGNSFNETSYQIVNGKVIITEADGDTFTYDLSQLTEANAEEFFASGLNSEDLIGEVKAPEATTPPAGTPTTNPTGGTTNNRGTNRTQAQIEADLDALREKREALEQKIKENGGKIEEFKEEIDKLYKDIEDTVDEYIDQAEDIAEDLKEQVKAATEKHIEKYKNGEYDSTKSLHNALAAEIQGILSATAMQRLMSELERVLGDKKAEVEPYIAEVGTLEGETETIQGEIEGMETEEAELTEELEEAKEEAKKADPQGFSIKGIDGSITQFDFFIDRDGNGGLTDASEFLGAQGFAAGGQEESWAEMTSLDTNGDGVVDMKELDAGNVKVVKTTIDANGNKIQEAMSASEAFGNNSDLKINTQQKAASEGDVPVNFGDYADNTVLGNFDVTYNGETYTGYQTADTMDYLNDNYNFTSGAAEGENGETVPIARHAYRSNMEFKYDIDALVDSIDKSESESELLEYAEDYCRDRGIRFSGDEKSPVTETIKATAAQGDMADELKKLEKELDFEIAV